MTQPALHRGGTAHVSPQISDARRVIPLLSLVVPTFNEVDNLPALIRRTAAALSSVDWEMIIVDDDSPDGTSAAARGVAAVEPRVRCIRRLGRRGLAGACIEGLMSSSARFVAVMDADLQHDETILPAMLAELLSGNADLVVGSRHVTGGSSREGFSRLRAKLSTLARRIARTVLRTDVADLMSGFFTIRRDLVEALAPKLSSSGFKILVDILACAPGSIRVLEIAYEFRPRTAGQSKLDANVALDFLGLVLNRATRGLIPTRFVFFALVGLVGVIVHLEVLNIALARWHQLDFARSQAMATIVAMTTNFFFNNLLTYRDMRLRGVAILRGLAIFYLICALGAVANVGVATWTFINQGAPWWVAGLAGIVMGAVWNYTLSSLFVWRDR